MKKYGLIFASLILFGCGGVSATLENDKNKNKNEQKKPADKKGFWVVEPKQIEITKDNQDEYLVGTWEAEDLGVILEQFGVSLPSRFIFNSDGTYEWEYVNNGMKALSSGKYKILDKKSIPYKMVLNQESETTLEGKPIGKKQKKEMGGILEITKNKKLKMVFYDRDFIPKVEEFQEMDVQIYRKTK